MNKILIVDDEVLVRIGIKSCIDWKENGFEEPLEAADGKEALQILESSEINIILTDIKMPEMDGLQLINEVRRLDMPVEVIILSCYNDFEYVKEGLRLGACDYLFKPAMLPADILNATRRALENMEKRKKIDGELKSLQRKVRETIPIVKEALILDLANGKKISIDEFLRKTGEIHVNFTPTEISLTVIRAENLQEVLRDRFREDEYLLKFAIYNVLCEVLVQYDCEVVVKNVDEYLVVSSHKGERSLARIRGLSREAAVKAREALKKCLDLVTAVGISKFFHTVETFQKAYEEACFSLDRQLDKAGDGIRFYEDAVREGDSNNFEFKNLLDELYSSDSTDSRNIIENIFEKIRRSPQIKMVDLLEISSNIVGILMKNALQHDGLIEEIYKIEPEVYSKLHKLKSLTEIESFVLRIADEVDGHISHQYRNEVSLAIKYMKKHLGDPDISLEDVARQVNMSPNYFSRIFKESTHDNFIDFITQLRIERAKELYKTTDLKVYQIAEKVGYPNWRYFCKIYKKYTGSQLTSIKK